MARFPGDGYRRWPRDEYDLLRLEPAPLDDAIASFCRATRAAAPLANRPTMDAEASYELFTFGRRAAVRAMRSGDLGVLEDRIVAYALSRPDRVDFRDAAGSLPALARAAGRLGVDARALAARAAPLATADAAARLVEGLAPVDPAARDTFHTLVDTPDGPGFVGYDWGPWAPTVPLAGLVVATHRLLVADRYRADATLASLMPSLWLDGPRMGHGVLARLGASLGLVPRTTLEGAMAHAVAGAVVTGEPRDPAPATQVLWAWLLELDDDAAAATLEARAMHAPGGDFTRLAVRVGRLFVLLVARGVAARASAPETTDSLRRFEMPIRTALEDTIR